MRAAVVLLSSVLLACRDAPTSFAGPIAGTWGGENAGLIAGDTSVHVHIGCTLGDVAGRIVPDADGRFDVTGTYNVDAYPVDRGIRHPARFSGAVRGLTMTLSVTLLDTTRMLGPVTLRFGEEPRMGPCPICRRSAGARTTAPD